MTRGLKTFRKKVIRALKMDQDEVPELIRGPNGSMLCVGKKEFFGTLLFNPHPRSKYVKKAKKVLYGWINVLQKEKF